MKDIALSQQLPWRSYSSLLFMATGLNATAEHTISLTNSAGNKTTLIDYAQVTVADGDEV
jgi:hypothetical protein